MSSGRPTHRPTPARPPVSPLSPPADAPWWTRAVHVLAIPMAFLLPAWTSLGRIMVAENGAVTAILLFATPVLFVLLLSYSVVGLLRAGRHPSGTFGSVSSALMFAGWIGGILVVVALGDFDELDEATLAPLARVGVREALVAVVATVAGAAFLIGVVGALVAAVVELVRTRRPPSVPPARSRARRR